MYHLTEENVQYTYVPLYRGKRTIYICTTLQRKTYNIHTYQSKTKHFINEIVLKYNHQDPMVKKTTSSFPSTYRVRKKSCSTNWRLSHRTGEADCRNLHNTHRTRGKQPWPTLVKCSQNKTTKRQQLVQCLLDKRERTAKNGENVSHRRETNTAQSGKILTEQETEW